MLKSTENHVFVWGVQSRTGEMVSVPDILWKSRVPPWFIRTVSGEEHWRSNLCIGRYYLASARGLTFAQTSLEVSPALFSQGSSGSDSCGDKFKQVGPVRRLLGKNAAPSCLSYAFSHCFMAEALMFPNTGALLTGGLTPVWSRSWRQIERTRELYPS